MDAERWRSAITIEERQKKALSAVRRDNLTLYQQIAATKGLQIEGFDLDTMFPAGTNLADLVVGDNGTGATWNILWFHLRRALLSILFALVTLYSEFPHFPHSSFGVTLRWILGVSPNLEHYPTSIASLADLEQFSSDCPQFVATALHVSEPPSTELVEEPKTHKLASGEIVVPTPETVEAYQRDLAHTKELQQIFIDEEFATLSDELGDLAVWALLSVSLEIVTVFVRFDFTPAQRQQLHDMMVSKICQLPEQVQKNITIAFSDQDIPMNKQRLTFVIVRPPASELDTELTGEDRLKRLTGISKFPDLFIAFDGTSNMYPLYALKNAVVFSPRRRELIRPRAPQLLDWCAALRFYQYYKQREFADKQAKEPSLSLQLIPQESSSSLVEATSQSRRSSND